MGAVAGDRTLNTERTIVHPTDFSDLSADAFAHALRVALAMKSRLYLVHIAGGDHGPYEWFPHVRETLVRWGMLENGAPQSAVEPKLGIKVVKVALEPQDELRGLLRFLDRHPSDLIVLATHGRDGLAHWLRGSVAEDLSREARVPTLFVAPGAHGFVEQATGRTHLRRVLVPVDHTPHPAPALGRIHDFLRTIDAHDATFDLVHVGSNPPHVRRTSDGAALPVHVSRGSVVDAILQTAIERKADLIAMPTAGHHGFLDAVRGSTTERVLRQAPCPVLAIPAH
jgi:nucleotide-binding universal stress UspA family protein